MSSDICETAKCVICVKFIIQLRLLGRCPRFFGVRFRIPLAVGDVGEKNPRSVPVEALKYIGRNIMHLAITYVQFI